MHNSEQKEKEDVNGNRKLFRKEVNNAKGGKVESCTTERGTWQLGQRGESECVIID